MLKLRGLKVHFLIREPWYFPVALDRREAKVVGEHIGGHGVGVHLEEEVDFLERDTSSPSHAAVMSPRFFASAIASSLAA